MLPKPEIASSPGAISTADRRVRLAALRAHLAEIERHEGRGIAACLSLGAPEIHAHLPMPGLAGGVLHEMAGVTHGDQPAAFGFVAALMAIALDARASTRGPLSPPSAGRGGPGGAPTRRFVANPRGLPPASPAFLVASRRALADLGRPYGRGLGQAGLDPGRLVLVETRTDKEALWALEEVLGSDAHPSVVAGAIVAPLGLTESRRLNLAAARHGTPLLVLGAPGQTGTSAAATRWRIAAAPAGRDRFGALAQPRWRIALERCRHGRPGEWLIEWDHAAYRFRLAASLADRAPAAGARLRRSAG
jgi:protein ImuA